MALSFMPFSTEHGMANPAPPPNKHTCPVEGVGQIKPNSKIQSIYPLPRSHTRVGEPEGGKNTHGTQHYVADMGRCGN